MSEPFKIKHCMHCQHAYISGPDYSVGIEGPTLEDCDIDVCPFGNDWEDYLNDKIDWEGSDDE